MQAIQLLSQLFLAESQQKKVSNLIDLDIKNIQQDTRKVTAGTCFVCIIGENIDGHQFAKQAAEKGAVLIIAQKPVSVTEIPVILVTDTKRALAKLAVLFYQDPSNQLKMIGVTGTNGKTTVTHMIAEIMENQDLQTGIIGTMYNKIGNEKLPTINTTPDSLTNQFLLSQMKQAKLDVCAMEVSSHALVQGRVWGIDYNVAVFTNLTQDHLEYHKTMENYFLAKSLLFSQLGSSYHESNKPKYAVINQDDPYGRRLAELTSADVLTYGHHPDANIQATEVKVSSSGTVFQLNYQEKSYPVHLKMVGDFNVSNALAAFGASVALGMSPAASIIALEKLKGVHGRFQLVPNQAGITVIVDYAHTPDGLLNVLTTAQDIVNQDIYCVVGCGGDRDPSKRPIMADVAVEKATYPVFTSDNPRTENPDVILDEMTSHLDKKQYIRINDRKKAINYALTQAKSGDLVLIAGKGHENYQIIGTTKHHFDDIEVVTDFFNTKS